MEAGGVSGGGVQAQMQVELLRQSLDMQGQTAVQLIQSATQPTQAVRADTADAAPVRPAGGIDTYA